MNSKPNVESVDVRDRRAASGGKVSASLTAVAAIRKVTDNSNSNYNDADNDEQNDNCGGATANDYGVDRANSAHQLATHAPGSNNSRVGISSSSSSSSRGSGSRYDQLQRQQVVLVGETLVGNASSETTAWQDGEREGEGGELFLEKGVLIRTADWRTTNEQQTSTAADGQHRPQRQVSHPGRSASASAPAPTSAVSQLNYCTAVDNHQSGGGGGGSRSSNNNNNNNNRELGAFNNRLQNWNAVIAAALEACGSSKSEYGNNCGCSSGGATAERGKAARGQTTGALEAEIANEFNCRLRDHSASGINTSNTSYSNSEPELEETCVEFNQQSSRGNSVAFDQAALVVDASELQQQKAGELKLKLEPLEKAAHQEVAQQRQNSQIKHSNYDESQQHCSDQILADKCVRAFSERQHRRQQRRYRRQYQHSDSIDLSAADTFWRKLSNLSRSITQRQQPQQQHLQLGRAESGAASAATTATTTTNSWSPSSSFGQLAPEVVGYLAKNCTSVTSRKQQQQYDSDEWRRQRQRQVNNLGGGAFCLHSTSHQRALGAVRLIGARPSELDTRNSNSGDTRQASQQQSDASPDQLNSKAQACQEGATSGQDYASGSVSSATIQPSNEMTTAASNQSEPAVGPLSMAEDQQQLQQYKKYKSRDTCVGSEAKPIKIVELPATINLNPIISQQSDNKSGSTPPADSDIATDQKRHQHNLVKLNQMQASGGGGGGGGGGASGDTNKQQQNQVKLSITTSTSTNATTTATRSTSGASSISSCIISDSTSVDSEIRLRWSKKMDFLLSIIGFAVDLANIWRFPYLVYKNGGGVFLIPYLTMLIFGGIPLFFLELCLGQFVKKGPITVWNKICPYMKGVGYCSILISWYVSFYYNILIAWSVYFIYRSILSFGQKMPWEECDNPWNNQTTCLSISQLKQACSTRNQSLAVCREELYSTRGHNVTSPASEFFVSELSQIDQSKGLEDMGYLRLEIVVCAIIVYLLHYFSLFRGLETSGKVVWVTATAPYMILSILLIRGLFLPGASLGIEYYLSPKLEKLAEPQVWIDAAGQVFYSIGVGFGVHLTYASFNSHNNNCYRDCLMTSAVNAATSVYSGLVVFVYLGYMATNLGVEIDKVASEGYSLVFEVYPEAMTTLPFARFWSILFFIMLLTLGIDSAMGGLEAVITGLEDEFKFAKRLSRSQLTALVILSSFLPSLISCTQGGAYTLFWFDIYAAGVSLLFSALFETIGVVYCYGLDKFILNIESMLGRKPQLFYIICWKYISPLFLMGVIFMSIYTAPTPVYRNYTFPRWSVILGWCLAFSSVAAIPIVAICTWFTNGTKTISVSPSKSPRKLGCASGSYNTANRGAGGTGGGSRNSATRKSPASQNQCKSISVNYSGARGVQLGLIGGFDDSQMTTATNVITAPIEHYNSGSSKIKEDML